MGVFPKKKKKKVFNFYAVLLTQRSPEMSL